MPDTSVLLLSLDLSNHCNPRQLSAAANKILSVSSKSSYTQTIRYEVTIKM